jgi:hypothetical protein
METVAANDYALTTSRAMLLRTKIEHSYGGINHNYMFLNN